MAETALEALMRHAEAKVLAEGSDNATGNDVLFTIANLLHGDHKKLIRNQEEYKEELTEFRERLSGGKNRAIFIRVGTPAAIVLGIVALLLERAGVI